MTTDNFYQTIRTFADGIEEINQRIDRLAKERENKFYSKPQKQSYSKTEPTISVSRKNSKPVSNLSPEQFMKAYKANPDEVQNEILKEHSFEPQQKISNYQVDPIPQQVAIVNLPPKFSSQEVLARVKNNENLTDILAELSEAE